MHREKRRVTGLIFGWTLRTKMSPSSHPAHHTGEIVWGAFFPNDTPNMSWRSHPGTQCLNENHCHQNPLYLCPLVIFLHAVKQSLPQQRGLTMPKYCPGSPERRENRQTYQWVSPKRRHTPPVNQRFVPWYPFFPIIWGPHSLGDQCLDWNTLIRYQQGGRRHWIIDHALLPLWTTHCQSSNSLEKHQNSQ